MPHKTALRRLHIVKAHVLRELLSEPTQEIRAVGTTALGLIPTSPEEKWSCGEREIYLGLALHFGSFMRVGVRDAEVKSIMPLSVRNSTRLG